MAQRSDRAKIAGGDTLKAVILGRECEGFCPKINLPEDKRGGVVVQGHMPFCAVGRLHILLDPGAARTGEQPCKDKKDNPIQQPQEIQYHIEQAHTECHLHKGRLG
jgi:hypothetical protein